MSVPLSSSYTHAVARAAPKRQCTPPVAALSVVPVQVTTISSPQPVGHWPSAHVFFIDD